MSVGQSRRNFLRTAGAAAAGYAGMVPSGALRAQAVDDNITPKFKAAMDASWLDQYDKPFDVNTLVGKPYILLFGYKGCNYCNQISQNLAQIKKEGGAALENVPVVLVNVTPEGDKTQSAPEADRDNKRDYVASYYGIGVGQSRAQAEAIEALPPEKQLEAAQKAYDDDKALAAKDRNFHLVFPPSNKAAQELQAALGVSRNLTDDQSHGMRLALVDSAGKCRFSMYAASTNEKVNDALISGMKEAIQGRAAEGLRK